MMSPKKTSEMMILSTIPLMIMYANGVYSYDEPKKEAIGYDDSTYYPQSEMDYKPYDMYDGVYNHYVPDKESYGSEAGLYMPKEANIELEYYSSYQPKSVDGHYDES